MRQLIALPTPYDAWVIGRLLVGHDVNGELDQVSETTRPLANRLASLPPAERHSAWDAEVNSSENADAWIEAVAAVDPEGPPPGLDGSTSKITLVRVSDVEPEKVEWLWPDRLPLGKLSMLVGDPGLGKSFLTLSIAASLSRGSEFPDRPGDKPGPCGTILLSAEDDIADTIRPRLDAAGADSKRIFALTTIVIPDGPPSPFNLQRDLPRLEEALDAVRDARLVVIDPVSAYLAGVDENKNAEVRCLLAPLAELASRRKIAVLIVSHMNKATGLKAIYRATGSLAFVAAARTVWVVAKDKEDPDRRLLLSLKNNLAKEATGLAFRIVDGAVRWDPDPVTITAEEALRDDTRPSRQSPQVELAVAWLGAFLGDGPKPAEEAVRKGNAALGLKKGLKWWRDGILKDRLLGRTQKSSFGGGWVWSLPSEGPREESQEAEESRKPKPGPEGILRGPLGVEVPTAAEEAVQRADRPDVPSSDSSDSSTVAEIGPTAGTEGGR